MSKMSPDGSNIDGNNTARVNLAEARKTQNITTISQINGWITKELMENDVNPLLC